MTTNSNTETSTKSLNLGDVLGRTDFGFPGMEGMTGTDLETSNGTESSEQDGSSEETMVSGEGAPSEPVGVEAATGDAQMTDTPAKKVYDTPYIPRGQYFKSLREQGLLQPRQPKVKADQPTAPKAKSAKQGAASDAKTDKPARSPKQISAIRGYYARKRAAAQAA